MKARINRRSAVKAAAAAGGLLLLSEPATAAQPVPNRQPEERAAGLSGEWFNAGKLDQPCAIFQHGRVLLLVNEKGDMATAHMTEANQFSVLKGWGGNVTGQVVERGKVILWKGGGNWKRT